MTAAVAVAAVLGSTTAGPGMAVAAGDLANRTPIVVGLPNPPPGCPFPTGCPSEKAAPYPSTIAVSGLSGTVTGLNVTLRDLTYRSKPADLDIVLVAPGGRSVTLMSDDCGDNRSSTAPIAEPITLTFDDGAKSPLPADGPCRSGTFRPTDDDDDAGEFPLHMHADDFLPQGPTPPVGTAPLSSLNGIDPNGTWSLFVVDDVPNDPDPKGESGRVAGGWSLRIRTSTGAAAGSDSRPTTGEKSENRAVLVIVAWTALFVAAVSLARARSRRARSLSRRTGKKSQKSRTSRGFGARFPNRDRS